MKLAAGSARLTKARGVAATTLDNLTLPVELLDLLELELPLQEFFDIVELSNFLRGSQILILWECAGGSSKEVIYPGRRYWYV